MSMIETRIIDKEEWDCDKCEKFKECNVKIDNLGTEFVECPDCKKIVHIYENDVDDVSNKKVKKFRKNKEDID